MNGGTLEKSVGLITGGTRGIGRAVAIALARAGASLVVVNYLQNTIEAERTRGLVEDEGANCLAVRANMANPAEIERLFAEIRERTDKLDHIVHCAALSSFKPLHRIKPNQWDLTMNINARSLLIVVQHAMSMMKEGSIVAVSSLGGGRALPNYGALGVTKAALESVVRYLGAELAPLIRVNGVIGGMVATDSVSKFPNAAEIVAEVVGRTPAGRLGAAEDIADAILFLLGPGAKWIYGQHLVVDGGISLR